MKNKKIVLGIGLLLALTLVLAGCFHDEQQKKINELQKQVNEAKKQVNEAKNKAKNNAKKGLTKQQLKKQKQAITDKDTDGKKFGYVKAVYIFNEAAYLQINYAQMLTGEAAKQAATKAGEQLDADYYISDQSPKVRTFEIADGSVFIMNTWQMSKEGKIGPNEINFNDYMNIFNSDDEDSKRMAASPYWVVLKDNKVVKVEEQYLP